MPHLTLFGMHYAPEFSGNAPYTTSLCEYLVAAGWAVDVHTGMPHYPDWSKQDAPTRSTINGVRVIRHNHHVPSHPSPARRAAMDATWLSTTAATTARKLNTDVVVGVVPNLSGAAAALVAGRRSGVPVVLWFQDLMGQAAAQSGAEGAARVAGAVRSTELGAARRANRVLVCADGFTPYLVGGGVDPASISVVRNWSLLPTPTIDTSAARDRFGLSADAAVAVHSGNMGAKQGLEIVVEAASLAPGITFILQGDGSERAALEAAVERLELDNVQFMGSLPPEDLGALLVAADVLLLTQRPSVTDMSLPSKLTTYLSVPTPVVASIHPESEAAALLSEAGVESVVAAGDPKGFAEAVTSAADRTGDMPRHPRDLFGSPRAIEEILLETIG